MTAVEKPVDIDVMRVAQTIVSAEAIGYTEAMFTRDFAAEGVARVSLVVTDLDGRVWRIFEHPDPS